MGKPKLQIIVLFQNLGEKQAYYARSPAPPLSGALVAGLTPPTVEVELLHEMVRPIDYNTDADFIALSFMDFCAPHAFEVAERFRKIGKIVVAGGKYPSTFPKEVIPHMDSVVIGEAETVWGQVVEDMVKGKLKKVYEAPFAPPLDNIPPPRYDLVEPDFTVPVVTEATRGCPYKCSFCQLTIKSVPFRCRPIKDVIHDLTAISQLPFYKRKMAMLYDNNLGGNMGYAKELLKEIAKLKLWGLGTQFSFDCLHDDEFIDLLAKAHCGMAFIGLESLNEPSLLSVHKRHNRVQEYEELFEKLKKRGILTFTGLMLALDEDTPSYYHNLPVNLNKIDPSSILLSISIPIPGTPFHKKVESEGRIFDKDLSHYEGDHLVFTPKRVSPDDVFNAFHRINRIFYSWKNILKRWWRFISRYSGGENIMNLVFRSLFISYIFFQLSIFQRDHAQKKVYRSDANADLPC
ncbi:MAG: B12-binding domain-containing radical SAM protein [Candidatus Cloacimonadota bacterium]|nr:MAG: B12-binding domain-containing radical SAM protein [Candidatus Cloacimonadota bacterium]